MQRIKWEIFLAITRERILCQIQSRDAQLPDIIGPDVYENLELTVREEEKGLEGADIATSTQKYLEWLREEGMREWEAAAGLDSLDDLDRLTGEEILARGPNIPRYTYYIHASADMIASFSTELEGGGYPEPGSTEQDNIKDYLHIVSPSIVLAITSETDGNERARIEAAIYERYRVQEEEEEEEDINKHPDVSKKIRGGTLAELYIILMQSFDYFPDDEEGFFFLA